jgi:hypothetical protein
MRLLIPFLPLALGAVLTPCAHAQLVQQELRASDGAADDRLGFSVSRSGIYVVVGARRNGANDAGSAYIFDGPTGAELVEMFPLDPTPGAEFGFSVGASNGRAVIGAKHDNDFGTNTGSAYFFDLFTGQQDFKLLASDAAAGDQFGFSTAIDGDRAILSAVDNTDHGVGSGAAYLFDVDTGLETFKLLPLDGAPQDRFGFSVSISGDRALVGAYGDDDNGPSSGSVYLFDATTGAQLDKWSASDGGDDDRFGASVAISGNLAVVGAWRDDDQGSNAGAAYVFDVSSGQELFKLVASDGIPGASFGLSVAISGDRILIGAENQGVNGIPVGSAYLFDATTGTELRKFLPCGEAPGQFFGRSVSLDGDQAVVGAHGDAVNGGLAGAAHTFFAPGDAYNFCSTLPNSSGARANLCASGSTSVAADDLVLVAHGVPVFEPGIFYYGPTSLLGAPFGDGLRCVGGPVGTVLRVFPFSFADASGVMASPILNTIPVHHQIAAGATLYFQAWFRDLAAGQSGFNLSDGLAITFAP